ncbi:MAG: hypothetical protein EOP00_10575 [Pedobacter sp.]|nr:MAG: hypothetical protein EOP00_10575 [Pedobacter sp.]
MNLSITKLSFILIFLFSSLIHAQTVKISGSEPDADITVNGQKVAQGTYRVGICNYIFGQQLDLICT